METSGTEIPPLCPRRSRKFSEATIKKNKSSLEILIQMGFPKPRAEKALAATGDTGVQLASDWLLSHVNDPTLDEKTPREYILYLCPVGQLQQELIDFWHKSFQGCGWNRAHNYFPHITLCSFFKAEDDQVPLMAHILKAVVDKCSKLPDTIDFEYFSSTNFIGLFVSESSSHFIKQLTSDFADSAKKMGVTVEPHKKQLHISLAYQFSTDKKDHLEAVAKSLNMHLPVRWDLRLYSRDAKLQSCQVRKVLYTHNPTDADELELVDGDFIFVESGEVEKSTDGWYYGTSWLTGLCGMFPGPFTERCAESEIWTMHRSIPAVGVQPTHKPITESSNGIDDEDLIDGMPKPPDIPPRGASVAAANSHVTCKHNKPPVKFPAQQPKPPPTCSPSESQKPGGHSGDNQKKTVIAPQPTERPGVSHAHPAPTGPPLHTHPAPTGPPIHTHPAPTGPSLHTHPAPTGPPLPSMHQISTRSRQPQPDTTPIDALYAKVNKTNKTSHVQPAAVPKTTPPLSSQNHPATSACLIDALNDDQSSKRSFGHQPESKRMSVNIPVLEPTPVQGSLRKGSTLTRGTAPQYGPRQLYVIRHGERIDFTFGKEWIKNSFDKHGNYIQYDLNMPKKMPKRKGGPPDFSKDAPLTIQGHFQASLIGEAMKDKHVSVTHVYASPSLRCIETACSILKGLGIEHRINVEPGLFEWLGWYANGLPKFMTTAELEDNKFPVNPNYEPIWSISKYKMDETTEQYYDRCHHVTKEIIRRHDNEGGNMILLAHAASLDACTRHLVGQPARTLSGFHDVISKIPYCSMAVAQEACLVRDTWYLIEPPILPFAHTNNHKYNWTSLTSTSIAS